MTQKLILSWDLFTPGEVSSSTKHSWSFREKHHCSILLNNWGNSYKCNQTDLHSLSSLILIWKDFETEFFTVVAVLKVLVHRMKPRLLQLLLRNWSVLWINTLHHFEQDSYECKLIYGLTVTGNINQIPLLSRLKDKTKRKKQNLSLT